MSAVMTDVPRQPDLITTHGVAPLIRERSEPPRPPERTASTDFSPTRCKVALASRDESAARLVTCAAPGDEDKRQVLPACHH